MHATKDTNPQPGFEPNFGHTYTVTIDKPYDEVFKTIGTSHGHDRTVRLSKLCAEYTVLKDDEIVVASDSPLHDITVRSLEPVTEPLDPSNSGSRILSRQSFKLVESVPVAFGLFHANVVLYGTICWDEAARLSLYESEATNIMHIRVWKCRTFEREGDNRTKITEVIKGQCPSLIRKTVQEQTVSGHTYHMDLYHILFKGDA